MSAKHGLRIRILNTRSVAVAPISSLTGPATSVTIRRVDAVQAQIIGALESAAIGAATVSELAVVVRPADQLGASLDQLAGARRVVVVDHPPFDLHLEGVDLRTVALVEWDGSLSAHERAELRWSEMVREFLASHRCM